MAPAVEDGKGSLVAETRFRAVLCGCGAMSKGWLTALRDTPALAAAVELAGLVDIVDGAAKARAEEFGLTVATGTDLDAVLAETRPDIVFDVVIPAARHHVVETALRRGCHVLSEKPMATSLAEAKDLVARAATAGKVHAIVQNRRFIPGVRRIRQLLDSGALGELTALHCDFFVGAHFGGFREELQNVLLLDMAIHTLDAARFMANRAPLAVYCLETNPRGSWNVHGAAANALFEFADDVVFNYRGSWVAEGANTSWESSWRVVGTRGTLLWDGYDKFEANVVAGNEGFFRPLAPLDIPDAADPALTLGHASVITDFVESIAAGRLPETVSSDNIKSLAMVFAAIESGRTRQRVTISI